MEDHNCEAFPWDPMLEIGCKSIDCLPSIKIIYETNNEENFFSKKEKMKWKDNNDANQIAGENNNRHYQSLTKDENNLNCCCYGMKAMDEMITVSLKFVAYTLTASDVNKLFGWNFGHLVFGMSASVIHQLISIFYYM